ncbi:uncharacterized protein LOC114535236 [Dendronephthya gigantea]|uniref:uncharacterized protein LOC114535236 n=1 Tax=Dendronephthya gigantea TaxID=151771 RepID=UPI001069CE8D|nr:uncharacterized protein LOC114535236 [Dendronephthya gigantea]
MEADPVAYDKLSISQVEVGEEFIRHLNLSKGDKVLDMGCGTGKLTKYIADIVGPDSEVVGVDPDAARIKIAVEKYKECSNLHFHVGDSVAGFPHDDQPYYDTHVSTHVFHWIPNDGKVIYIQTAYKCLKSGGKLAICCSEKMLNDNENDIQGYNALTPQGYRDLFQAVGLFNNVVMKRIVTPFRFESFEYFKQWYRVSAHQNPEDLDSAYFERFITTEDDGRMTWNMPIINITTFKD